MTFKTFKWFFFPNIASKGKEIINYYLVFTSQFFYHLNNSKINHVFAYSMKHHLLLQNDDYKFYMEK